MIAAFTTFVVVANHLGWAVQLRAMVAASALDAPSIVTFGLVVIAIVVGIAAFDTTSLIVVAIHLAWALRRGHALDAGIPPLVTNRSKLGTVFVRFAGRKIGEAEFRAGVPGVDARVARTARIHGRRDLHLDLFPLG